MTSILQQLAEFVASVRKDEIPDVVSDRAVLSTLDCIAAAVAGASTANAASMRAAASRVFGEGSVPAWFTDWRGTPAAALLANCAAASALDIDDGHRGASGHPGAAIVPAVLTMSFGRECEGPRLLTAIVLGYDVALRIAAARQPGTIRSYASGRWCGYGVAAALGWLRGLDARQLAHAMAIAGAEAPQNLPQGACRMSSVKGSSPWGALTALAAVERAQAGATGPIDLLDRSDVFDGGKILAGLGEDWSITSTYIKPYAACRVIHAAIDAVLELMAQSPDPAAPVEELVVETFREALMITNDREPETLEAAQFSIPFSVAVAALRGRSALRPLRAESLQDPDVLSLSRRVKFYVVDEFADAYPRSTPSRVRLRQNGIEREQTVLNPLGDTSNPLDYTDIEAKFRDLARDVLSDQKTVAVLEGVARLRSGPPASLFAALTT